MRDFVKEVSQHSFFESVGFSNSRYTHDLVTAQLICLEMAGGPTNVKNADLNKMYLENKEFDNKSNQGKQVRRVLGLLKKIFPDKTPELERYNVISLYCIISELLSQYVIGEVQEEVSRWFLDFESQRRKEELKSEDEANSEWIAYKEKVSHSTDGADSIRFRMEFMMKNLLNRYSLISTKDNQREFTHLQKLTIFRRDKGICKIKIKCDGSKLAWDNWHCDHIVPWSKGGKTTVENGQVSCSDCNLAKGSF